MLAIHILDTNLVLRGEICAPNSLRLRRSFREVGDFEMQIPQNHPMAKRIERDNILCPVGAPEKSMIVEDIKSDDGSGLLGVSGYTLDGLLKRRICIPPSVSAQTYGYDRIIGDAETIMRHYVQNNAIEPESTARRMDCLALEASNEHRGLPDVPWSARFEQLDALLTSVADYCDSGYAIIPDFDQRKLVFAYLPGRDLTGTDGQRRVAFSVAMGNATSTTYSISARQTQNAAIVGGAGEDENRMILAVCPGGEEGIARREVFVDAGSLTDPAEISQEGTRRISGNGVAETISAQVIETRSCRYGQTWDLGDKVIVVSSTAQMEARITQVQEIYDAGRAVTLDVTFGDPPDGIVQLMRSRTRPVAR